MSDSKKQKSLKPHEKPIEKDELRIKIHDGELNPGEKCFVVNFYGVGGRAQFVYVDNWPCLHLNIDKFIKQITELKG